MSVSVGAGDGDAALGNGDSSSGGKSPDYAIFHRPR